MRVHAATGTFMTETLHRYNMQMQSQRLLLMQITDTGHEYLATGFVLLDFPDFVEHPCPYLQGIYMRQANIGRYEIGPTL